MLLNVKKGSNNMFAIERQKEILETINVIGRISVSEIQKKYLVGYETAKRDLMILEEQGAIQRTYGGAIKKDNTSRTDCDLTNNLIGKIAYKALLEIKPEETIFLDDSKYSFYIAHNLNIPCHVITHNIYLAGILTKNTKLNVTLIGGPINSDGNIYDNEFFNKYNVNIFDKAFISGNGYDAEEGLSTDNKNLSILLHEASKLSNKVICMLEHKWIGTKRMYPIVEQQFIARLYTELDN